MFASVFTEENLLLHAENLCRKKSRPGYDSMTADGALAWLRINGERLCRDQSWRGGASYSFPIRL